MKCKKHPKYMASQKPRCDCPDCWDLYMDKNLKLNHKKIGLHSDDESVEKVARLKKQLLNCFLELLYCQNNRSDDGRKKDVERWFTYEQEAEEFIKEVALALTGRNIYFEAIKPKGVWSPELEAKIEDCESKGQALLEYCQQMQLKYFPPIKRDKKDD